MSVTMSPLPKQRDGFTLVELLVAIAIIGILVALLLPAVQAAREAGRRAECTNHLKQIGLASLSHEAAFRHFPTGGWGALCTGLADRGAGLRQPGGWIYNLLPFVEETSLHQLTVGPNLAEKVKTLSETPVPLFYCPSRRDARAYVHGPYQPYWASPLTVEIGAKTDYAINSGTDCCLGALGSANVNVPSAQVKSNGLVGISFLVSLDQITDGTSHTYLIGEKNVDPDHYFDGLDFGDNENAYLGHDRDHARYGNPPPQPDRPGSDFSWSFGSAHPAAFSMAYCDGSVHSVSYEIDDVTLRRRTNRSDGEVISDSGL